MYLRLMLLVAACLASPAVAGPFGIEKGQAIKSLKVVQRAEEPGVYIVQVPQPNAQFASYFVMATAEDGVCAVLAMGKEHEFDNEGKEVRAAFADLRELLNSKYNIGRMEDSFSGTPGTDIDFTWLLSIKQHNRVYRSVWDQQLTSNLKEVILSVEASTSIRSHLFLTYRFDNIESCFTHLPKRNTDGL